MELDSDGVARQLMRKTILVPPEIVGKVQQVRRLQSRIRFHERKKRQLVKLRDNAIRELRSNKPTLSQRELGKLLDLNPTRITQIERHNYKEPHMDR